MSKYYIQITKGRLGYYYSLWKNDEKRPIVDLTYKPTTRGRLDDAIGAALHLKATLLASHSCDVSIRAGFEGEEHIELVTDTDIMQVTLALG
jgi:hypothetical protein